MFFREHYLFTYCAFYASNPLCDFNAPYILSFKNLHLYVVYFSCYLSTYILARSAKPWFIFRDWELFVTNGIKSVSFVVSQHHEFFTGMDCVAQLLQCFNKVTDPLTHWVLYRRVYCVALLLRLIRTLIRLCVKHKIYAI